MSVGIAEIATAPIEHVATGNPLAIGLYIQELEAMGYSSDCIQRKLEREGLRPSVTPKEPASCKQIEDALLAGNYFDARNAMRALKKERNREGFLTQLSCLRMRLEYRHGVDSQVVKMLMKVRRAEG